MGQEMAKLLVKDIKVRKHVQALQDQVLKVDRCHYTEEYQREVSHAETHKEIVGINLSALEVI